LRTLKQNPKFPEGINASDENPLKEFTTLLIGVGLLFITAVLLLSIMANWIAPHIPFSWEHKAVASAAFFSEREDLSNTHSNAEQALGELGERLIAKAKLEPDFTLAFYLLDEDVPNAFATLGGHVFVTTGLLQAVSSENALAMVVAHEIAHIRYRHPIQTLTRGALISIVYSALMGGGGSVDAKSLLGQAGLITSLSFNRDMEEDADKFAITTVLNEYGHLEGAEEFFVKMLEKSDQPEWFSFFQTHPHTQARMSNILDAAAITADPSGKVTPLDSRLQDYIADLGSEN